MFKKLFGFGKTKEDEDILEKDVDQNSEVVEEASQEIAIEFAEFVESEESEKTDKESSDDSVDYDLEKEEKEKVEEKEEEEEEENVQKVKDEKELKKKSETMDIIDLSDVIGVINLNDEFETDNTDEIEADEVTLDISDCELVQVQSEAKVGLVDEVSFDDQLEVELDEPKKKASFFEKLKSGLTKTSKAITDKIDDLLNDYGKIDDDLFDELEEILITADIGMSTTMEIIDELKKELRIQKITDSSNVKQALHDVLVRMLSENNNSELISKTPSIILVIGVNGAGKTTTIGKIANQLKKEGKSVILAAGDTFRAAAIDQLQVWGERSGVTVIAQQEGSDPAAVIFDAIQAAKSRKTDVLICDTAGRLHNKVNLMNELAKVFKVVEREFPDANKEVLLVLDATTGQNAINQAKTFKEAADITGIVLTKLDGTAKGGVILGINSELKIPVKLIGVGEGVDDLQKFNPVTFVDALLNMNS